MLSRDKNGAQSSLVRRRVKQVMAIWPMGVLSEGGLCPVLSVEGVMAQGGYVLGVLCPDTDGTTL